MDVGVGMMQVEVTNRCNLNCPHCFYYEAGEYFYFSILFKMSLE